MKPKKIAEWPAAEGIAQASCQLIRLRMQVDRQEAGRCEEWGSPLVEIGRVRITDRRDLCEWHRLVGV